MSFFEGCTARRTCCACGSPSGRRKPSSAATPPTTDEISWEETGWIAAETAREALAIALTGMLQDGEITRTRASELARMVLHDNAAKLYGFKALPR